MLMIVGTIRVPAGRIGAAGPAMRRMVAASRAEDGCLAYTYAEDIGEPGLIRVHELWRDAAALERHFASPHLAEWRAGWASLGIGERDLRLYEVGESRPT